MGSPAAVDLRAFTETLTAGCIRMTEMLARDGEGAEHLIRATVRGAANEEDARRVAKSLVNSPLVKTMVHGADPNVGRLLMAVGKCFDVRLDPNATDASINGHPVVRGGRRLDFDDDVVRATLAAEVRSISRCRSASATRRRRRTAAISRRGTSRRTRRITRVRSRVSE